MSELNRTYERITDITPNNDGKVPVTDGFHVNVAGDIRFLDARGNEQTLTVLAGYTYRYRVSKVFATDTTATGIHGLYFSH